MVRASCFQVLHAVDIPPSSINIMISFPRQTLTRRYSRFNRWEDWVIASVQAMVTGSITLQEESQVARCIEQVNDVFNAVRCLLTVHVKVHCFFNAWSGSCVGVHLKADEDDTLCCCWSFSTYYTINTSDIHNFLRWLELLCLAQKRNCNRGKQRQCQERTWGKIQWQSTLRKDLEF